MSKLEEIYMRINSDRELSRTNEKSEIRKFFAGKTLFISGGTGFLGKCLVQKLLKSCSDLKHIYILMRENKNISINDLLKKYLQDEIFDPVRNIYPNFERKVTAVAGDLTIKNLGLSENDRKILTNEVNIIYHSGACVNFHTKLGQTLNINVLGTERMLNLAKDCLNLEIFVHVSSAYSHCYNKHIDEIFYSVALDIDKINNLINIDNGIKGHLPEEAIKKIIGKFPNVYTYSKALSEALVQQYAKDSKFAYAIYRPSVVLPTFREPLAGWCCNTNGPILFLVGACMGIIHATYYLDYPHDFVPCDLTINALIAITWDRCDRWKFKQTPIIYNYGSSTVNPTSFKVMTDTLKPYGPTDITVYAMWMYFGWYTSSKILFWISHIFLHFIPACVIDSYYTVVGKKRKAFALFMKAQRNLKDIFYFANGNWKIYMPGTLKVIDRLNSTDKEIFYCDIRNFDWKTYYCVMARGIKLHIMKENSDFDESRKKYAKLWYMHYGLVTTGLSILLFFVYKFFL